MSVSQFPPARLFGSASKLRRFSHIPLISRPPPCTVVSGCREFLALFFCVLSRQMGFSARFSRVIPARTWASLHSLLPTLLLRNPQIQFLMLGLRPIIVNPFTAYSPVQIRDSSASVQRSPPGGSPILK